MKVRALLFLCICFSLYVFGQKDISGTYFSKSGTKIEIIGNNFNYIEPHIYTPVGIMIHWQNVLLCGLMLILLN